MKIARIILLGILFFSICIFLKPLSFAQISQIDRPATSPTLANRDEILRTFHSIHITTKTEFFKPESLERELYKQQQFLDWNLVLVDKESAADVSLIVDRPALTFDYTFKIVDIRSSIVLAAGKVIAYDGVRASPGLAKQIVERIKVVRPTP